MFADITSANVVGYQNNALQEGATMIAPAFVDINASEEGVDLTKLIVGGDFASEDVVIQTLTAEGYADKTYSFFKPRRGDWQWIDDNGETLSEGDVVFTAGTGLWIAGVDNCTITTAGQVSTSDRVIKLVDGAVACGNSTAVPLDLLSIVPSGEYASEDIVIQTLTADGYADKTYSFFKPRRGDWQWIDDNGETLSEGDVVFPAGAGLWVAGVEGAFLTIPGPTL